jgi:EmrB/QacA subfamily drug resistance transporter
MNAAHTDTQPLATANKPDGVLTREVLAPAAVVVLGAIMTILDATIVNVALPTLGRDLHTSIATIQWVPTIYLLALVAVIPLTGWAAGRFGAKPVWLASLGLFLAGSLAAGLAPSIGALIGARVVQGLGAGMIMPLGQAMLAQVAGPTRMGRVMSIVGVPMLLAPIFGPLIGGSLVQAASWRWIFLVNLPVGVVAIMLAARLLPATRSRTEQRLDLAGAVLLCGGLALFLYGLAQVGQHARWTTATALAPMIAGAALVAAFGWHALRAPSPLLDLRLFRRRGFATGAAVNFVLGTALFGAALLLPLYFEVLRGRSPLDTGLLLAPQGLGAALAIAPAGYLTDKLGPRRVVPVGVLLAMAGAAWYTRIGPHTPYPALLAALFLIGAGLGATITPAMAAAYHDLPHTAMEQATSMLGVVQRVAGALGSALLAVILQQALTARLPGYDGSIARAGVLATASPHAADAAAHAFGIAFTVALVLCALALLPALLLPARHSTATPPTPSEHTGGIR